MKPIQTPSPRNVVREQFGRFAVLACAGSGEVQVLARAGGTALEAAASRHFGAGPRKRPSPRGLSGGPG